MYFGFGKRPVKKDVTDEQIKGILNGILGNYEKNVRELSEDVRALIDTDDAPEKLQQEIRRLKKQLSTLKNELADVKAEKVRQLQEVEHLVKIKKEKLDVDFEKRVLRLKAEQKDELSEKQEEHYRLFIARLDIQAREMATVHKAILNRLPNLEDIVKSMQGVTPQTQIVNESGD